MNSKQNTYTIQSVYAATMRVAEDDTRNQQSAQSAENTVAKNATKKAVNNLPAPKSKGYQAQERKNAQR